MTDVAGAHGYDTYLSVDGNDISPYCDTLTYTRSVDSHDITTYGRRSHVYAGGLKDGKVSFGGKYDTTAAGPHDVLHPLANATDPVVVEFIRRPEGTGAGLPQETFNALLTDYVESSPVADMVAWSAEAKISGDVTEANQ